MGVYKLTYMNGGEDTSIREANFDSDLQASHFVDFYNSMNDNSRIIRVTKVILEMREKEKQTFLKNNFNSNEVVDLKVLYRTTKNELFNITLPYIDLNLSQSNLNSLMSYINNFSKIEDVQYKKSKFF